MRTRTFNTLTPYGETELERVLWMALFAKGFHGRRGLPYVLVGDPGTGKTSVIERLSRVAGLYQQTLNGSLRPPQDFLGLPTSATLERTEANAHLFPEHLQSLTFAEYAPFSYAVRAALAGQSMLFFDEANTAPEDVQAAMLRVVLEGVIGELKLPPGVRMMLAMNRPDDTSGASDFSAAMGNRVGWLDWHGGSVDQFANYLVGGSTSATPTTFDPADLADAVDAIWGDAWAEAAGVISGFLHRRPEFFRKRLGRDVPSGPFPSDRSWEFATRALAGCIVFGLGENEQALACSAAVGADAWAELAAWLRSADLPDPGQLLDGAVTYHHKPQRLDRTAAVLDACLALVLGDLIVDRKAKRVSALWELLLRLVQDHPAATDLALRPIVQLCTLKLMQRSPDAYKLIGLITPMLIKANIDIGSFA